MDKQALRQSIKMHCFSCLTDFKVGFVHELRLKPIGQEDEIRRGAETVVTSCPKGCDYDLILPADYQEELRTLLIRTK